MELNETNRPLTEVPVEETSAAPVSTVSAKEETESATPRTEIQTQEEVIQRLKEINKDVCNADKQEIDQRAGHHIGFHPAKDQGEDMLPEQERCCHQQDGYRAHGIEQLFGGGVDVDADCVHAVLDDAVERF